jgi:hypothetical protein
MAKGTIARLNALVEQLRKERQAHANAIVEIDTGLADLGMGDGTATRTGRRRGRPRRSARPKKKTGRTRAKGKRKRKRHAVSGLESVVRFVKRQGKKGATGAQITKHWKAERRAGNPYNTLGQLVREKKLKRQKLKNERGSRYVAP